MCVFSYIKHHLSKKPKIKVPQPEPELTVTVVKAEESKSSLAKSSVDRSEPKSPEIPLDKISPVKKVPLKQFANTKPRILKSSDDP